MSCRKNLNSYLPDRDGPARDAHGQKLWRSLEELSETPHFRQLLEREFPRHASEWPDSLSRRRFLTLMGASLALGGVAGCSVRPAPSKDLVPFVRRPEDVTAGKPLFYATTMTLGGDAVGLLVESYEGRPIKIEGNPDHPASLGATSAFHQASVLSLYDPDRAQVVTHLGQPRTWTDAAGVIAQAIEATRANDGAGLRILAESVASPTLADQIAHFLRDFPQARLCIHEPIDCSHVWQGTKLAFGEAVAPRYDFTRAEIVLALDADFLASGPGHLRYAADFMSRRRIAIGDALESMNRLYVVEPVVSCTGAKADHRAAVQFGEIEKCARQVAAKLGLLSDGESATPDRFAKLIDAIVSDLGAHRGARLSWPGTASRPQFICWRTRSTTTSGTSAAP